MISELKGSDLGVARNENHRLYEWTGKGRVVFSATMKGKGLSCHFAANKEAMREIKQAINEMSEWAFKTFECRMILAMVSINSVERVLKKCGFKHMANHKEGVIYARLL